MNASSCASRYRSIVEKLSSSNSESTQKNCLSSSSSLSMREEDSTSTKSASFNQLRKVIDDKDLQLVELRAQRWELADALRLVRAELTQAFEERQRQLRHKDTVISRLEKKVEHHKSLCVELERALAAMSLQRGSAAHLDERLRLMNQDLADTQDQSAREHHHSARQIRSLQAKVVDYESKLCDFTSAIQQKNAIERELRELLRSQHNEVKITAENATSQIQSAQQHASSTASEARNLRAVLVREQQKSTALQHDLEVARSHLISEQANSVKLEQRVELLSAQIEADAIRRRELESGELASVIRERNVLQHRVEKLQSIIEQQSLELEKRDKNFQHDSNAVCESKAHAYELSQRVIDVETALNIKETLLEQLDEKLLQSQKHGHSLEANLRHQEKLVENLYCRLQEKEDEIVLNKDTGSVTNVNSEIDNDKTCSVDNGNNENINSNSNVTMITSNDSFSLRSLSVRILNDGVALCNLITSRINGIEPDVRFLVGVNDAEIVKDEKLSHTESIGVLPMLKEASETLDTLRKTVVDEYANRVGDSCAMQ